MRHFVIQMLIGSSLLLSSSLLLGYRLMDWHWKEGNCEASWRYISTGEKYRVDTLIRRAMQKWNDCHTGLKFKEETFAPSKWLWKDFSPHNWWAQVGFWWSSIDPITGDTLIDSVAVLLNKKIIWIDTVRNDTILCSWRFDMPMESEIGSTEVDAYSVILHGWGHWYGLGHSEYSCAIMWKYRDPGKKSITRDIKVDDVRGARYMYSDNY